MIRTSPMPIPKRALKLEEQGIASQGEPTLGQAYEVFREQWVAGDRERELALHLMFVAWYLLLEPASLTGRRACVTDDELRGAFNNAHATVLPSGAGSTDVEALYACGLMAHLSPWLLGPVEIWGARSNAYRASSQELAPNGISPDVFTERGGYGEYFRSHALLKNA